MWIDSITVDVTFGSTLNLAGLDTGITEAVSLTLDKCRWEGEGEGERMGGSEVGVMVCLERVTIMSEEEWLEIGK